MFGYKRKCLALAVVALALMGAEDPVKVEFPGWYSNPVFSADGKILAYGRMQSLPFGARTTPTQIILWDLGTGREMRRIEGPADDSLIGPLALSPDGKQIAIGMWNTAVRIWDVENGKETGRLGNSQGGQQVRFAPDGRTVGWLRNDEIYLADPATAKELQHIGKEANSRTTTFAFVDGGKTILSGHSQSTDVSGAGAGKNRTLKHEITCWAREAASGKKLHQVGETIKETRGLFQGPPPHTMFVSADGQSVMLTGEGGNIQVCDVTTGKTTRDFPAPWKLPADDPLRQLAFSANGKVVAVTSAKGVVGVWDLAAGKELRRIETGQSLEHVALSPDGKTIAVTHQTPGRVGAVLLIYRL
jgi:WD40 repeat protein